MRSPRTPHRYTYKVQPSAPTYRRGTKDQARACSLHLEDKPEREERRNSEESSGASMTIYSSTRKEPADFQTVPNGEPPPQAEEQEEEKNRKRTRRVDVCGRQLEIRMKRRSRHVSRNVHAYESQEATASYQHSSRGLATTTLRLLLFL